jgi:hypothetical protein
MTSRRPQPIRQSELRHADLKLRSDRVAQAGGTAEPQIGPGRVLLEMRWSSAFASEDKAGNVADAAVPCRMELGRWCNWAKRVTV